MEAWLERAAVDGWHGARGSNCSLRLISTQQLLTLSWSLSFLHFFPSSFSALFSRVSLASNFDVQF